MSAVQTPPRVDHPGEDITKAEEAAPVANPPEPAPQPIPLLRASHRPPGLSHALARAHRPRLLVGAAATLALVAGVATAAHVKTATSQPPTAGGASGAVAAVRAGGLVIRLSPARLLTLLHPSVVTSNGHGLSTAQVRLGDRTIVQGNRVVDVSQSWTTLQGLVAVTPVPGDDSMIVQLGQGRQIVVDLDSATRVNGSSPSSTPTALLMAADQVQLRGAFDQPSGEMTLTESVTSRAA